MRPIFALIDLVRPLLEDADQGRRLIEDRIIAGPQATLNLADQLADVRRRYDASAAVEETLARGYQVRDRAWSEVPYLILWSRCRNQPSSGETPIDNEPGADAPRPTKDELRGLVDRAAQLDAALQQVERQSSRAASAQEQLAAIDAVTAELEASLTQIHARLLEDAKRLSLAGSATSHTLCELTGVLATPFVPGKLRAELRDRYGAVTEEVDRVALRGSSKSEAGERAGSESPASPNGPPFDVTSESRTDVDRLVQLVTAMLGTGNTPTPNAAASDPRALGTALREALQTAAQGSRATTPTKSSQTDEPGQDGGELPAGWSDVPGNGPPPAATGDDLAALARRSVPAALAAIAAGTLAVARSTSLG